LNQIIKLTVFIACLFPFTLGGQTLIGTVFNNDQEPLIGANLYWAETTIGTVTNTEGTFEIPTNNQSTNELIISYVGYETDTIKVDFNQSSNLSISLKATNILSQVTVSGQQDAVIISNIKAIKSEQITQTSLRQAACCDLAGCFGGQSTVMPQTTNVVTNAKELRILGLSGVYNQVLIDGFPLIKGLAYTYGISSIPGTLVDNIFIAKGANSVFGQWLCE